MVVVVHWLRPLINYIAYDSCYESCRYCPVILLLITLHSMCDYTSNLLLCFIKS